MYTLNSSTGVVTRDSDGAQVAPVDNPNNVNYLDYIAWIELGNSPTIINELVPETWIVTRLAFRNRFTFNEKMKIETMSQPNPAYTQDQALVSTALRVIMDDLEQAEYIDLKNSSVIEAITQMAVYGIITQERCDTILNTPPAGNEQPG